MQERRGFTLIEVLMVVAIVGILLAVVVPKYGSIASTMNVRSAKQEMATLLAQGRATAIQTNQTVKVIRSGNVVSLIAVSGTTSTIIAQQDLGSQFGVTLSATRDSLAYDSRGMVTGNTTTLKFIVSNATTRDSVCLMALGKVTRSGCSL
jgi:prepilin-type N-terminal cleavage/methylation domain-containing protein